MKPNTQVIEKWVKALRSGEYKQGKNALKTGDTFCCLGVLCDLHREEVGGDWDFRSYFPKGSKTGGTSFLPSVVCEWAGLTESPYTDRGALTDLNDSGIPFNEIAEVIEKEYLKP